MSLTGKKSVSAGDFEMAMAKVEATGGSCGERGTVKFTPNARARDTNNLRLIQVVKTTTGGPSAPDFSLAGTPEARRDSMMTTARAASGSQPAIEAGYFVDHQAATSTPRTAASDPAVSPAYRDHWANASQSQDGHKRGTDIASASLWDFPQDVNNGSFLFETEAKGFDNNVVYGTVKWQFTIASSKITGETWSVQDNASATFNAALDNFNQAYHNPGSSSAPAAAPTGRTGSGGSGTPP